MALSDQHQARGAPRSVFVVDDDPALRDAMCQLFEEAGYHVVAFSRAEDLLATLDPSVRGCLVLDVHMPGMRGPELQAELALRGSHLSILFLTGHGDVPTAVKAIRAGARDVLVKPAQPEVLLARVDELLSADAALVSAQDQTRRVFESLTAREREVLVLLAEARAHKEIGERLGISARTVEVHRAHITQKSRCSTAVDLAGLVKAAREAKLL